MKKHSIRLLGGVVLATLAFSTGLSAQTLNDSGSYRSVATGGLFKQEVDRIYDNPAYIGAKLDGKVYLEYDKSLTKEKTNVYTGLSGFNDNNRYLLGCSTRVNDSYGIAALMEFGINTTPNSVNLSRSVNGLSVNKADNGKVEGITTQYADTNADNIFDHSYVLTASKEDYTKENIVNAVFGLGGYKLGGMTVGFSLERNADGSSVRDTSESYNYTATNLLNNFVSSAINYSDSGENSNKYVNYTAKLGAIIPAGSMPIEGVLSFALNKYESSITDSNRTSTLTGGLSTANVNGDTDNSHKDDGYTIGLLLQARTEMMGFQAQPYFKWTNGGLSPYKSGNSITTSYAETILTGNSEYINTTTTTSGKTYSGSRINRNVLSLGSNFRKPLTNDLLLGLGAEYSYTKSKNKYNGAYSSTAVSVQNNGNGTVDNGDYTLTTTSSYLDATEEEETIHTFKLPIGLEYSATPTLCFRLGYSFIANFDRTETTITRSNINAPYNDYDYNSIPGNETTYDGLVSGTKTDDAATHTSEKNYTMTNLYTVGIGYNLSNKVQLDLAFGAWGGQFNVINSAAVMTSATFVF